LERGKTMNQELRISVDIPESYQNKIREAYQSYKKTYNDILSQIEDVGEVAVLSSKKLYENFTDRKLTVYFSDDEEYYDDITYYEDNVDYYYYGYDIAYYEEDIYNKDILWLQKRLFYYHYYDGEIEIEFNNEKQEEIKDIFKKLREVSSRYSDEFENLVTRIPNTLENIVIKSTKRIWESRIGKKIYICLSLEVYYESENSTDIEVIYLPKNMFLRYYTCNFVQMKIFNSSVEKNYKF